VSYGNSASGSDWDPDPAYSAGLAEENVIREFDVLQDKIDVSEIPGVSGMDDLTFTGNDQMTFVGDADGNFAVAVEGVSREDLEDPSNFVFNSGVV
jgi:hypothetical protein